MTTASTPRDVADGPAGEIAGIPAAGRPGVKRSGSSTGRRVLRAVVGIAAAITAFVAAAVAFVAGAIVTTGCFIGCTEPDPLAGIPILLLAVALAAVGLAALWWGFVNRHWRRAWITIGCLSAMATFAVLSIIESAH